jgi:hypothetical protein
MITIIKNFITFVVSKYNSRCIPVLKQLFPIPNRINVFMDEEAIVYQTGTILLNLINTL